MIRIERRSASDKVRRELKGFGAVGIIALLVIVLVHPASIGGLLVLAWAKWSQTPYPEVGFSRPRSWIMTVSSGVAFGAAFKVVMKSVVMPLLGAPAINQTYHYLAGNSAALPSMIFTLTVGAGFGEETVFRGFLYERCRKIFGRALTATFATIIITSAIFASAHFVDQGLPGVEQALFTGAAFGALYILAGELWLPMAAHIAFDLTALAMIYWDLEPKFAHLFFK